MRWFHIRKAQIEERHRTLFEQLGEESLRPFITYPSITSVSDDQQTFSIDRHALFAWLTEQYDRAERKETWSLAMEVAITIFVGIEVAFDIYKLISGKI